MPAITRHQLPNGLSIILKEQHSAPVVSWWMLYRIGSRNERTGQTGLSHWVEHMMFKGTPQFPGGVLDKMISREGGTWNAQTSMDYTAYYETMPADRIDLGLRLEADRMVNAIFDPEEVESERTVIISEREGSENSPMFWLDEEVRASMFRVHGYHHEIIGDMADLHTITRDDLYNHYRQFYRPNNAVAVAVGDFDTESMLRRIEELYGGIPAGDPVTHFNRPEPEQFGERRVTVERPGATAFLEMAYRVPPANHPDWFAMAMLNAILTGAGGAIDNKTSRLYRAIVESGLGVDVDGGLTPSIDPYLYDLIVTLREGTTHEQIESVLDEQLEQVAVSGVTTHELERARKQARAIFAYSTERVTGQASWLTIAETVADYTWFENYVERLSAVTAEDVQRAAQTYLRPQNRTVGWLIPTGGDDVEYDEDDAE